jgi:transposase
MTNITLFDMLWRAWTRPRLSRRYVRRWKIERLFARLFNFCSLVVRYEYHPENFRGFLHVAVAVILLRHS